MYRCRYLRKILGVFIGLLGAIILVEFIPLWFWYCSLLGLLILFLLLLLKII